jgi:putative tryptophan/tyrosine transport system substrate-binding protein
MQRRDFVALLGGATVALPFAEFALSADRVRRIGVLMPLSKSDPIMQRAFDSFVQGLQKTGWSEGKNAAFEIRHAMTIPQRYVYKTTRLQ